MCRGEDGTILNDRFHDFVMSASHILNNRQEGDIEKIVKNLVEVSGNGTMLILGYRIPNHDDTIELGFRRLINKYFDIRNGRQVIYDTPDGEIVIMYLKRKPFASFFEAFEFGLSLPSSSSSTPAPV